MKVHFIAIGGSAMHNLAIALSRKGIEVTGSDDEIFEPSKSRLKKQGILPGEIGWNKDRITDDLDAVILGMHARGNNPELTAAKEKNIPVFSYPEYLYEQSKTKKRIVIGGSHGKTTTTSLIASIFQETKIDPTIINGGVINSINNSAKLGKSDWSILEADESDGSFVFIPPTYSIITNIDREHMDFYNSMEELNKYFIKFVNKVPSFGKSFICLDDKNNRNLIKDGKKNPWEKVVENIEIKESDYKGTKDVSRMRTVILNRKGDFTQMKMK